MIKRPFSLTMIGWFLTIMGILSVFAISVNLKDPKVMESMRQSPLPLSVQHAILAMGVMVMTGSGLGILKGRNWARFLYLGWGLCSILLSLAIGTWDNSMIPGVVFYLVLAYFLFRPAANLYFSHVAPPD